MKPQSHPNPLASSMAKLIEGYTYDWMDEKDVFKVREQLRKLGIENELSYKTNEDMLAGKYKQTARGGE